MIRNVAVFCASAYGVDAAYRSAAEQMGAALGARGIGLVYGGATVGLMQAAADAALQNGGRVIGVIPRVLVEREIAHPGITELHMVETMHARKAMMSDRADAFIVLPGGFGTLEEVFEVLTWQTLKLHAKPVVLLNTNGFYDNLLAFLDHAVAQGMLKQSSREALLEAATVEDVVLMLGLPTI